MITTKELELFDLNAGAIQNELNHMYCILWCFSVDELKEVLMIVTELCEMDLCACVVECKAVLLKYRTLVEARLRGE